MWWSILLKFTIISASLLSISTAYYYYYYYDDTTVYGCGCSSNFYCTGYIQTVYYMYYAYSTCSGPCYCPLTPGVPFTVTSSLAQSGYTLYYYVVLNPLKQTTFGASGYLEYATLTSKLAPITSAASSSSVSVKVIYSYGTNTTTTKRYCTSSQDPYYANAVDLILSFDYSSPVTLTFSAETTSTLSGCPTVSPTMKLTALPTSSIKTPSAMSTTMPTTYPAVPTKSPTTSPISFPVVLADFKNYYCSGNSVDSVVVTNGACIAESELTYGLQSNYSSTQGAIILCASQSPLSSWKLYFYNTPNCTSNSLTYYFSSSRGCSSCFQNTKYGGYSSINCAGTTSSCPTTTPTTTSPTTTPTTTPSTTSPTTTNSPTTTPTTTNSASPTRTPTTTPTRTPSASPITTNSASSSGSSSSSSSGGLTIIAVVGIVVGMLALLAIIAGAIYYFKFVRKSAAPMASAPMMASKEAENEIPSLSPIHVKV